MTVLIQIGANDDVMTFSSWASAADAAPSLASTVAAITVLGYAEPGDGGACTLSAVDSLPSHAGYFDGRPGVWWQISDVQLRPQMFGLLTAGSVCRTTLINALQASIILGRTLYVPAATYEIDSYITPTTFGHISIEMHSRANWKAQNPWVDQPMLKLIRDEPGEDYRINIRGGRFDMSAVTGRLDGAITVNGQSWHHVLIEEVECYGADTIEASGVDGFFFLAGLRNVRVRGCRFTGCQDAAVYISGQSPTGFGEDATVEDCDFIECSVGTITKREFQRVTCLNLRGYRCNTVAGTGGAASPPEGGSAITFSNIRGYKCAKLVAIDKNCDGAQIIGVYAVEAGRGDSNDSGSATVAITDCSDCLVMGVQVVGVNATDALTHQGVVLVNSAATCQRNTITHCKIHGATYAYQGTAATGSNRWLFNEATNSGTSDYRNIGSDDIVVKLDSTGLNLSQGILSAYRFSLGPPTDITIASDAITLSAATGCNLRLDTEGAAATDNLATINGGSDGDIIFISTANSARDVTLKDGTGNLSLAGDIVLDTRDDTAVLKYSSTSSLWKLLSFSNNA